MVKRHIPDGKGRTYCGRDAAKVACIDLQRDCVDEAECKACQRSDDRRVVQNYRAECRAAGVDPATGEKST